MRTKLSPLEELRFEREILRRERQGHKDRLLGNLDYTKNNFGHLLVGSLFSSAKSGVSDVFSVFAGKKTKSEGSNTGKMLLSLSPLLWEIAQPILLGFAVKKVKSVFTRKKKKK